MNADDPTNSNAVTSEPSTNHQSILPGRHDLKRFRHLARGVRKATPSVVPGVTAVAAAAPANPFGNSVQFLEVAYADQVNSVLPPFLAVSGFLPSAAAVTTSGLTIELWFKAESSGILVGQPMSNSSGSTALAPLLYVDANGLLRGGLFDGTLLNLVTPLQNLVTSLDSNNQPYIGAANSLATPLSVVDGDWHHAALVVAIAAAATSTQPAIPASQSLYLDGRLAAIALGSFGLTFVTQVSGLSGTWSPTSAATQFGGSIIPEPASFFQSSLLFPYPQGFDGCLNELRSWSVPITAQQIQQLMAQPLGADATQYTDLFYYLGSSQLQTAVQAGTYISLVSDAPPFDPFPLVTNRIPGYQNFGLFTAVPFSSPAVEITFQPFQVYSTKIGLRQGDSLQITFPSSADGSVLTGTFSLTVTTGATGIAQSFTGIVPKTVTSTQPATAYTITAPLTGTYRLDLTYSTALEACTANMQFMVVPGPTNTLMQLMLDVEPALLPSGEKDSQIAYTDPTYPLLLTTVADPRYPLGSGYIANVYPYWPPFTDETAFPIPAGEKDWSSALLTAYLNLVANVKVVEENSTFADFLSLGQNGSTVSDPGVLQGYLDQAYLNSTGDNAPAQVPTAPFDSAVDQVYAFICNANILRAAVGEFLSSYASWAQEIIDDLLLNNIPGKIATNIYNDQFQVTATLKGPSAGDFIANLLIGSAIIGAGAVLAALVLTPFGWAAIVPAAIAVGAIGGAGANVLSELLGSFLLSSTVQAGWKSVSYATLEEVSGAVAQDLENAYQYILKQLADPGYLQLIYSNYGLLQALQSISASALFDDGNSQSPDPVNNPLTIGTTYASWRALIPSVFTWQAMPFPNNKGFSSMPCTYFPKKTPYDSNGHSDYTVPSTLSINEVFSDSPGGLQSVQQILEGWQSQSIKNHQPPGQFVVLSPIFTVNGRYDRWGHFVGPFDCTTGGRIATWCLRDQNNAPMSPNLSQPLFGVTGIGGVGGKEAVNWLPVDQNQPFEAASGAWYWNVEAVRGAVTFPYDAFINWAADVPGYSPQILAAGAGITTWWENSIACPAEAIDVPPSAPVTVSLNTLEFGVQSLGSATSEIVTLTNNQITPLTGVTIIIETDDGGEDFTQTNNCNGTLAPNGTCSITVNFEPSETGLRTGTITINSSASNIPNSSLTVELSGTGVQAPPTNPGNMILQGDPAWNQLTLYIFSTYQDAIKNWSTGTNAISVGQLNGQNSQLTGLPSGWIAAVGTTTDPPALFMIFYYCNDVFLQLSSDGNQARALMYQAPQDPSPPDGSIKWVGSPAWNAGATYSIYSSLADALQNLNSGTNAIMSGSLDPAGATIPSVPGGWLVVYGSNQGSSPEPYVIVQFYSEDSLVLGPYSAQALAY